MSFSLNSREQHILWATIHYYIMTAEPVGSKALMEEYKLSVSSATIRNSMGILEKAGLLYQPYTSSGRVPSDSGYRVYVDHLITKNDTIKYKVEQTLNDQINLQELSLNDLLWRAAQILATLSGYIALITVPQSQVSCVKYLQLIQIEPNQIILAVVMEDYATQSVVIQLPPDSEAIADELEILSNFLNEHLKGKSLKEIQNLNWGELDLAFQRYSQLIKNSVGELIKRSQPQNIQMIFRGLSEVLRHREFMELNQVQPLVYLLEEQPDQLSALIYESDPKTKITIRIGGENPLEPIKGCTLISSSYHQKEVPVGSVGVLGPTRMYYENSIAVVEAIANYLSDALSA